MANTLNTNLIANSSAKRVSLRRQARSMFGMADIGKLLCKTSQFEAALHRVSVSFPQTANSSAKRVSLRRARASSSESQYKN